MDMPIHPLSKHSEREKFYQKILQSKPHIIWKSFIDGQNLGARLFFPEGHNAENDTPCVAFFHGGMWVIDNSLQLIPLIIQLNAVGIACILPEYRYHHQYDINAADILQDAQDFWQWISRNASALGLDPTNITLAGVEAGGLMALHAAMPQLPPKKRWWFKSKPKLHVNMPAALALFRAVIDVESPEAQTLNIKAELPDYADINPINRLDKDFPPIFIAHGDLDPLQDSETSDWFGHEWHHLGNKSSVYIPSRVDHTLLNFEVNPFVFEQMMTYWQSFMAEEGLWPEVKEEARDLMR